MRVYLDICAIQRPLDTANQVRIVLEAEAVLGLVALCDAGQFDLVSSEALIYETRQNPLPARREHAMAILAKAKNVISMDQEVKERAAHFSNQGVKPLDALHLALAEASQADYFCTCDDQLLRKAKGFQELKVQVVSPVSLLQEIEK